VPRTACSGCGRLYRCPSRFREMAPTAQPCTRSRCLWHSTQARASNRTQIELRVAASVVRARVAAAHSAAVPPEHSPGATGSSTRGSIPKRAASDFKQAPEWAKVLVILLTSTFVACFEFAICRSTFSNAPFKFGCPACNAAELDGMLTTVPCSVCIRAMLRAIASCLLHLAHY
jgi:hypothetical protein